MDRFTVVEDVTQEASRQRLRILSPVFQRPKEAFRQPVSSLCFLKPGVEALNVLGMLLQSNWIGA
jgi:hypothetical protein